MAHPLRATVGALLSFGVMGGNVAFADAPTAADTLYYGEVRCDIVKGGTGVGKGHREFQSEGDFASVRAAKSWIRGIAAAKEVELELSGSDWTCTGVVRTSGPYH